MKGCSPRRFRFRLSLWLPIALIALIAGTVTFVAVLVSRSYLTTITITAEPVSEPVSDPLQSRFLPSTFYYPIGVEHPKDTAGRPMTVLAQINFDEVPRLRGYPKKGILQFFINSYDDLLGWDTDLFGDPSKRVGYRVRYFPEVDADPATWHTDFSFLPDPTDYGSVYLPLEKECTLTFSKKREFVNGSDCRFHRIFGKNFFENLGPLEDMVWDWFFDLPIQPPHHKIGGWGNFVQDDPRASVKETWLLLFQMDSDSKANIWWGDIGVGNFFIRPEDLKRLDFSNVIYEYQSG